MTVIRLLLAAAARRVVSGAVLAVALALFTAACSSPAKPAPPPPPDAPAITCPLDITKASLDGNPVTVAFDAPAIAGGAAPVTVTCTPTSGTGFVIGTTTVGCTAQDRLAREATCSFKVQVSAPPKLQRTRFLAFGDSLTWGRVSPPSALRGLSVDPPPPDSYPTQLLALLKARYTAQTPILDNAGWPGETTLTGVGRLPALLASLRPEVVLLMEGANDLNSPNAQEAIGIAKDAIKEMVDQAHAAGAMVFLATLPPQRSGALKAGGAAYVAPYNYRMAEVATLKNAVLVDIYAAFGGNATTDLVGLDGLHLTTAGYKKVADTFMESIRSRLEIK